MEDGNECLSGLSWEKYDQNFKTKVPASSWNLVKLSRGKIVAYKYSVEAYLI